MYSYVVIVSKYIVPKNYSGITLFPFIFLKRKSLLENKTVVNHESIHLKQQLELLIVLFYLCYGIEFILRYIKHRNWRLAYRSISFEKEAYENENNMNYTKERPLWNFISYF